MSKQRTHAQIKNILESYRRSQLSKSEFCRQKDLPLTTLCSWLDKEAKNKLNFVSVSVENSISKEIFLESKASEKLYLKCPSGFFLEIPSSVSASWLSNLLKELS